MFVHQHFCMHLLINKAIAHVYLLPAEQKKKKAHSDSLQSVTKYTLNDTAKKLKGKHAFLYKPSKACVSHLKYFFYINNKILHSFWYL